jgi:hypothetical protein
MFGNREDAIPQAMISCVVVVQDHFQVLASLSRSPISCVFLASPR